MQSSTPLIFPFFFYSPGKTSWPSSDGSEHRGLGEIFRTIPLVWLVQVLGACANMTSSQCFYYLHSPGQHNFTTTWTGPTPDDVRRGLYHGVAASPRAEMQNSDKFSTWYQAACLLTGSLLTITLGQPATFVFWVYKH